jgi:hypothetical protein
MGHAFGLDHSFDASPISHDRPDDGRPGAYGDRWDIMSAMTGITPVSVTGLAGEPFVDFGTMGTGLNAVNMDVLGWLPNSAVWRPSGSNLTQTVVLRPLNRFDYESFIAPGSYIAADVFGTIFEFRTPYDTQPGTGGLSHIIWDSGLARPGVFAHRRVFDSSSGGTYHSVLIASDMQDGQRIWVDNLLTGPRVFVTKVEDMLATLTVQLKPIP